VSVRGGWVYGAPLFCGEKDSPAAISRIRSSRAHRLDDLDFDHLALLLLLSILGASLPG
jgi:hypothetical protein